MKQSMHLHTSQRLNPQLQQAIRLLQLSTFDLQHEIQEKIDSNPMLESTPSDESDRPEAFKWTQSSSNQGVHDENLYYTPLNLQDYLRWQLELTTLSDVDRVIGSAIIDAIDENGFLIDSPSELHKSLNTTSIPLSLEEIEAVRHCIQHFDPEGCGACNVTEELLIQLEKMPSQTPYLALAQNIIHDHISLLAKHSYQQLMTIYHSDNIALGKIVEMIHSLNPRPGLIINDSKPSYTIPDLIVRKNGAAWQVELNPNSLPHISINRYYASLIQQVKNKTDQQYLKNNLQEAQWFLKSIQNRQETLLKVARYIVDYQKEFLEFGEEAMKPLVLNDIAHGLGMHESTLSRATTQKFIHTPRGLFELNYFFSSHVSTANGEECSSTAIRAIIKKLIAAENHEHPLSDNKITTMINEQGVKIARRTVAKYREAMFIAPSSARKSMSINTTEGDHYANQFHRTSNGSHPCTKGIYAGKVR